MVPMHANAREIGSAPAAGAERCFKAPHAEERAPAWPLRRAMYFAPSSDASADRLLERNPAIAAKSSTESRAGADRLQMGATLRDSIIQRRTVEPSPAGMPAGNC